MNGEKELKKLLNELNINTGDVVFLHSSFNRLSYLKITAKQLLYSIINAIGKTGTLVLPSYAWNKTWEGYRDYFQQKPIFDVRNTRANIGYIPETFRSFSNTKRSLSYWWSVCAYGKLANLVTKDQDKIEHYYGNGSTFEILRENNVKILGLGVSLNTTSLSPMVDFKLGGKHTQQVFTEVPKKGIVIDYSRNIIETYSYWLLPNYVRSTKPSRVMDYSARLRNSIYRKDYGTTIQFSYEFNIYFNEALRLGLESEKNSKKLPWLENA